MTSKNKVILFLKTAHFDLPYTIPSTHFQSSMENTRKAGTFQGILVYVHCWYRDREFKRASSGKQSLPVEAEELFYFVMNIAMNFVGSTFKVI